MSNLWSKLWKQSILKQKPTIKPLPPSLEQDEIDEAWSKLSLQAGAMYGTSILKQSNAAKMAYSINPSSINPSWYNQLTWKCEICGIMNLDEGTAVLTYPLKDSGDMQRNLKFCKENEPCKLAAYEKAVKGEL